MTEEIKAMLAEEYWAKRAKRLGYSVESEAYDPYDGGGWVQFTFKSLKPQPPHPDYPWLKMGTYNCRVSLSVMPEGCGMVVLSGLWGFCSPETNRLYAYMIDLVTTYATNQAGNGNWGNLLLATTSSEQRRANTYFRTHEWNILRRTTKNPRSGLKMWLWGKQL